MLSWLRKLRTIVKGYDADLAKAHARIAKLEKLLKDSTDIAVDVGLKSPCQVIVIGRYRNADYVQTFSIDTASLGQLIDQLREMGRYGTVRRVDAPHHIRSAISRELGNM